MKKLIFVILAATIMASCGGVKVTTDYDKSVDFTKFKTYSYYGWTEESDQILNRFDKERIENAFGDEFAKRNINFVEKDGELIVSLFIVVEQKTSKTAYSNHYNMGGLGYHDYDYDYGVGWGGGVGMGTTTTRFQESDYEVGTLVCDVFSSETKKLIWQGVGTGTVDANPQTSEKNIPKAVAAIMDKFPVKSK